MEDWWYIAHLLDENESVQLFDFYKARRIPTFLFRNSFEMGGYLCAAYASDDMHSLASEELGLSSVRDGYEGWERLCECFQYHVLVKGYLPIDK